MRQEGPFLLFNSENGILDPAAINKVQTVVIAYEYPNKTASYREENTGRIVRYTQDAVNIYFYDVASTSFVRFLRMTGADFPERIVSYWGGVSNEQIIRMVRTNI